jgi:hypothetical protein
MGLQDSEATAEGEGRRRRSIEMKIVSLLAAQDDNEVRAGGCYSSSSSSMHEVAARGHRVNKLLVMYATTAVPVGG